MYLIIVLTCICATLGYLSGVRKDDDDFIKQIFPSAYMYALFLGFYGCLVGILCENFGITI